MKKFLGHADRLVRFVLLTCGLLTLAGTVACLLLPNLILAIASSIVSAWSIGLYLDTVWAGMLHASQPQRPSSEHSDRANGPSPD
jgi:uncharacterized membrane protein